MISVDTAADPYSWSASAAADCVSLDETRRRELLRERIAARREGQPLKTLGITAICMVELAVRLRSAVAPRAASAAPSEAVIRLAARGKSPLTWNRYAATLLRWGAHAGRVGSTFLPADPTHFVNFLAAAEEVIGASGHTHTEAAIGPSSHTAHTQTKVHETAGGRHRWLASRPQ